jgi:hypothetical protein
MRIEKTQAVKGDAVESNHYFTFASYSRLLMSKLCSLFVRSCKHSNNLLSAKWIWKYWAVGHPQYEPYTLKPKTGRIEAAPAYP